MKYRSRIYYSAEQKDLMWDRWQAGDSLHEIARMPVLLLNKILNSEVSGSQYRWNPRTNQ